MEIVLYAINCVREYEIWLMINKKTFSSQPLCKYYYDFMSIYWDDNDMVDKRKTFTPTCSKWIWKLERLWWFRKQEFRRKLLPKYELKRKIKLLFYTSPWNFQFIHSFVFIEQEITYFWFIGKTWYRKTENFNDLLFYYSKFLATFDDSTLFVHFAPMVAFQVQERFQSAIWMIFFELIKLIISFLWNFSYYWSLWHHWRVRFFNL